MITNTSLRTHIYGKLFTYYRRAVRLGDKRYRWEYFKEYLEEFSKFKPEEYKIVTTDNTAFHSTKDREVLENIFLPNILRYSPKFNPYEQICQYKKKRFKDFFETIEDLKDCLHQSVSI